MSVIIKKIELPYHKEIPGGLHSGKQIVIKGKVRRHAERFHVNLECHDDPSDDIAFHFNPRQSEGEVVRNSCCGGWGGEEREQPCFPFGPRDRFEIRIVVLEDFYRVYVNDHYFCDYGHKTPFSDVKSLSLGGDAKFTELQFQDSMAMPYNATIPGGLYVGKAIRVRGVVNPEPNRFCINFCQNDEDIIAFHFNPRFDETEVVRNALIGDWGDEEREQTFFPFSPDQLFDVTFFAMEDYFRVFVNGQRFTDFAYRSPMEEIRKIKVNGDVNLALVHVADVMDDSVYEPIGKGLHSGDSIVVKGMVRPDANKFHINLREKSSADTDSPSSSEEELADEPNISLHFNPRVNEQEVVKNTMEVGNWGGEERDVLLPAFQPGQPFEVRIYVHHSHYQIFVNSEHYCDYHHRLPHNKVKFVQLGGDAWFYKLQVDRAKELPQTVHVPGGHLLTERWFVVSGVFKPDGDRFCFNLENENDQIALHFNPRIGEDCVVRNSLAEGWEAEEREQPFFPFAPGKQFEVLVCVKEDCYKVYVNGAHYVDFCHRQLYYDVCRVKLEGDAHFFPVEFL